jgi:hypothetical protein
MSRRCRACRVGRRDHNRRHSSSRQHNVVDPDTERDNRNQCKAKIMIEDFAFSRKREIIKQVKTLGQEEIFSE